MKTIQQINRTITNIRNATKKFKATVQQLTVDIFGHALEHGDYTALNRPYDAMSNGTRREAWVVYIVDHSSLKFDRETSNFKLPKTSALEVDYDAMTDVSWYDYTQEAVQKCNVDNLLNLEAAVKRYNKAKEEGIEIKGNQDAFLLRVNKLMATPEVATIN